MNSQVTRRASSDQDPPCVAVLMAIHNRRDLTLRAVERCMLAAGVADVRVHFYIFDDGSTDGSADHLRQRFGDTVSLLDGDGTAYWAKGMSEAEAVARHHSEADFLLWLNDDVSLYDDALKILTEAIRREPETVVVGAMRQPGTRQISYSGYKRRSKLHPLRLAMVETLDNDLSIDTLHGNCVLVPVHLARKLGGIDGSFSHGWADIDYGLRATSMGISIQLAPQAVGECEPNRVRFSGSDLLQEWKSYTGVKGAGNFSSLRRILKRHAGRHWPLLVLVSYANWWLRAIPRSLRRRRDGIA